MVISRTMTLPRPGQASRRALRCFAAAAPQAQARQRDVGEAGQEARPQQPLVDDAHPPRILGVAILEKAAEGERLEEDARLGRREILAVIGLRALPGSADHALERARIKTQRGGGTTPPRAPAPLHLTIGHPVDEKDDVPRLLAHQSIEDLEHRLRQEARLACDLEDAETEEGIHALAEAEILEGRFDVGRQRLDRLLPHLDAVAANHHADQLGVALFLETLEGDSLP